MNSALGTGLILAALVFGAFGAVIGFAAGLLRREEGYPWARRAAWAFAAAMIGANLVMVGALLQHDFSVKYVSHVGSRSTPVLYTLVSLWSALEGSILFWGAVLGGFVAAFLVIHRRASARFNSLALAVMMVVGVFFAFLLAGPANPFTPTPPPVPLDGPGPNPQLQNHWLMIVHPPALYLGYVGLTVPFAIAMAGLLAGELGESWMTPLRRWTLVPWLFLTFGIVLGGWWAYAVLGWGGYWAWDPVENASLLPWLTATAFMHATMVQERKRTLKLWTLALALVSFWLTLLGTFMTRSGVFNSVHAFTQSDIGPAFLVFLALVFIASIVMLAVRGPLLVSQGAIPSLLSREGLILVGNVVLVAVTFTVLLGTVFPLVIEAVQDRRISVGEPYFNKLGVPLLLALVILMGVGPALPWGASTLRQVRERLLLPVGVGAVVALACWSVGLRGFYPLLTFGACAFVAVVTLREMFLPAAVRVREKNESVLTALGQSISRSRRRFGGYVAHLGVVVMAVAVAASSAYVKDRIATLKVGESLELQGYTVRFVGLLEGQEPHRSWVGAELDVTMPSGKSDVLVPRQNYYANRTDPMGTPAVRTLAREDLYTSLIAYDPQKGTASLHVWVFPLVGWIWWSLAFFLVGTLIAVWPVRSAAGVRAAAPERPEGGKAAGGLSGGVA